MTTPDAHGDNGSPDTTEAIPDSSGELAADVKFYEGRETLSPQEFAIYLDAAMALSDLLGSEAIQLAKGFDFDGADQAFTEVIQLHTNLRRISQRELDRTHPGPDARYRQDLAYASDQADSMILLFQGIQSTALADERRIAGDFLNAELQLATAIEYFNQLAGSDLPYKALGDLRLQLAHANGMTLTAIQLMRESDFRGAYSSFDGTHAIYRNLIMETDQGQQTDGGADDAQMSEFRGELEDQLQAVKALQGLVEMLREAQDGNFADAVHSGREAIAYFERLLNDAVARQASSGVRLLHELELERAQGWISWINAELAVDECRWKDCHDEIRKARNHWNDAGRLARQLLMGLVAQLPEAGNIEMLFKSTLRRCQREENFRRQISTLEARLDRSGQVQVFNQGGSAVSTSPQYNISGNITAGAIGSHNEVKGNQFTQNVGGVGDLKELTAQLDELRKVLAGAARTREEQAEVEAVTQAHESAMRNDEEGVRGGLAKVGRWALRIAEQMTLTTVATVIRAAMGA